MEDFLNIEIQKLPGMFDKKQCYVHARAVALRGNKWIMTAQKLNISGDDFFEPLCVARSEDGGLSWSGFTPIKAFEKTDVGGGAYEVLCDATHLYHKKTGRAILLGCAARYGKNDLKPVSGIQNKPLYAVYDEAQDDYGPVREIKLPHLAGVHCSFPSSSEFLSDDSGDLFIPVAVRRGPWNEAYVSAVMRCGFDGETITFKEMGNFLEFDDVRGAYEPSVCRFNGRFYLTLRSDTYGLFSVSDDGLHFSKPEVWRWDTGDILPNYNTQQHWLTCGGRLHLVYTRRSGNNDHVFRHRAPLYIAEVDTEKMQVCRHSERIVAPERGARLGNFGTMFVNDNYSVVTVSEWMQPAGCERFGSDNSIFIARVKVK